MNQKLKRLRDQVIVITGASSGIGLSTARRAAKKGAKLVLAARSTEALEELRAELEAAGREVVCLTADVAEEADHRRIADAAKSRFGRIDTWINNAGVGMYGKLLETPVEDQKTLFETNFWGVVYGSQVACYEMRQSGGALINVGSVVSDRALPLQGAYAASKAAVKNYTDALRMELEADGVPISVTLIQPTSIDTPFPQHARNYMEAEPRLAPPVYSPDLVAKAILHAAEHPQRNVHVGGSGKAMEVMGKWAPRLTDRVFESTMFDQQKREQPSHHASMDTLEMPSEDLRERGEHDGMVMHQSWYNAGLRHPLAAGALALGAGLLVAGWVNHRRTQSV